MSYSKLDKFNLPQKVGDKFSINKHRRETYWEVIYTADGFLNRETNAMYQTVEELLKNEDVNLEENLKKSLLESNFIYNEILVLIKETRGIIPIRDCIYLITL